MGKRLVSGWMAVGLWLAACSAPALAQDNPAPRQNTSGPTADQIRSAPIDFEDELISPFLGFGVGELIPEPAVEGFRYDMPDGTLALLHNCAADRRCEAVSFYQSLGPMTEDGADEIEESLWTLNALTNPENEAIKVSLASNGRGGLLQNFRLGNTTPAGYFHSRYPVFLEGMETLEQDELLAKREPPVSPLVAKWGSYATAVQVGWWADASGGFTRYSWIEPGEKLLLESYNRWGGANTHNTFTVSGDTLTGTPTFGSQRFTSRTRLRSEFASGRVEEIDESLYSKTTTDNFAPYKWRSTRTSQPRFPDAAMIKRAQAQTIDTCPPNRDAVDALMARARLVSDRPDGGFGGTKRIYAPDSISFFGTRPVSVEVQTSGGRPHILTVMLPGVNPRSFEPQFHLGFRTGAVICTDHDDYGSCDWHPPGNSLDVPMGRLVSADITRTIYSDTQTRLSCSYRTY